MLSNPDGLAFLTMYFNARSTFSPYLPRPGMCPADIKANAPSPTNPRSFDSQFPCDPCVRASHAMPRSSASSLSGFTSHSFWARSGAASANQNVGNKSNNRETGERCFIVRIGAATELVTYFSNGMMNVGALRPRVAHRKPDCFLTRGTK